MKDWNPTEESILLIQNRINEKLAKIKYVKFYSKKLNLASQK